MRPEPIGNDPPIIGESSIKDGWTMTQIERLIRRGRLPDLVRIPSIISMDPPDRVWCQTCLLRLARHPHSNIRGNAILGFGHLARTTRRLNRKLVLPAITKALQDGSDYVRGSAEDARSDCRMFLKWAF